MTRPMDRCPRHGFPIADEYVWWCGCAREHTIEAQFEAWDREQTALYGPLRRCVRCGRDGRNFDPDFFCPPCKRWLARAAEARPFMLGRLRGRMRDRRLTLVLIGWAAVLWWLATQRGCELPSPPPPPSTIGGFASGWHGPVAPTAAGFERIADAFADEIGPTRTEVQIARGLMLRARIRVVGSAVAHQLGHARAEPAHFQRGTQRESREAPKRAVKRRLPGPAIEVVNGYTCPLVQLDIRGRTLVQPAEGRRAALAKQWRFRLGRFFGVDGCGRHAERLSGGLAAQSSVPFECLQGGQHRASSDAVLLFVAEPVCRRNDIAAVLAIDVGLRFAGPPGSHLALTPNAAAISAAWEAWASGAGVGAIGDRLATPEAIVGAAKRAGLAWARWCSRRRRWPLWAGASGKGLGRGGFGVLPVHGRPVARRARGCSPTCMPDAAARRRGDWEARQGCPGRPATVRSAGVEAAAQTGATVQSKPGQLYRQGATGGPKC